MHQIGLRLEELVSANNFLFADWVSANNFLFADRVSANNFLFADRVSANIFLFADRVSANNLFLVKIGSRMGDSARWHTFYFQNLHMDFYQMRKVRVFFGMSITWTVQNIYWMPLESVSILRKLIFSEVHNIYPPKVMKLQVVKNQHFFGICNQGGIQSQKWII